MSTSTAVPPAFRAQNRGSPHRQSIDIDVRLRIDTLRRLLKSGVAEGRPIQIFWRVRGQEAVNRTFQSIDEKSIEFSSGKLTFNGLPADGKKGNVEVVNMVYFDFCITPSDD